MSKCSKGIFLFIVISLCAWNTHGAGYDGVRSVKGSPFVGKQLVLNAKGTASAYACEIPATDLGTTQTLCFDVPIFNMKNGAYVGTLTDSLADVQHVDPLEPSRLLATITSVFHFTEWKRQPKLVTRVLGSVQPFTGGSPTMTHMTGGIPTPGDNNILSGTGRFTHASGEVRESGAVNLSGFHGQAGDEVVFDLIFVINLN